MGGRWPSAARRFSVSTRLARTILVRNGIELRAARPAVPVDEDAVVGAYRKHRSLRYVATVMRTSQQNIVAILDAHGEPHSTHTPPEIGTSLRSTPPERFNLEFRAEFFNAFNHAVFSSTR